MFESETILITPNMARLMLSHSYIENRKKDPAKVRHFVLNLKLGVKFPPLEFDEDLNLINGQHRLAAIIEFGEPVEMEVKWKIYEI